MPNITPNVSFTHVAREWRCKWNNANENKSLSDLQVILEQNLAALKGMEGAKVQRVVCGGCLDFKIIVKMPADKFGAWETTSFGPEA